MSLNMGLNLWGRQGADIGGGASPQFVGGQATSGPGGSYPLTSLTGGLASSPSVGDLVIVAASIGTTGNQTFSVTGYTAVSDLHSDDTLDANLGIFYKVLTGGDTTSFALVVGTTADVLIHVWRGVNGTTPLDVTSTTATGINSQNPNPPAITPVTSGAQIIVIGHSTGLSSGGTSYTGASAYLSNYFERPVAGGFKNAAAIGSVAWTSGAYDPAVWTGPPAVDNDAAWAAATLALRPA